MSMPVYMCTCAYMDVCLCIGVDICACPRTCVYTQVGISFGALMSWTPADFGSWPPMGMGELLYLSLLLRRDSVQGPRCCHFCPPRLPPPLLQITRKISAWKRWAFGGHTGRRCCSQLSLFQVHIALACFKLIICHYWVFSAQPDCSKRLL